MSFRFNWLVKKFCADCGAEIVTCSGMTKWCSDCAGKHRRATNLRAVRRYRRAKGNR